MPETTDEVRSTNPTDPAKIQVGDYMAFTYWGKIKQINGPHDLLVTNLDTGTDFSVRGRELIVTAATADRSQETKKVNQTQLLEILVTCYNRPFTVDFEKDDGSPRTMRCRLIKPDPLRGRSQVEDLEQPANARIRLINHRTVSRLVVDGVEYVAK